MSHRGRANAAQLNLIYLNQSLSKCFYNETSHRCVTAGRRRAPPWRGGAGRCGRETSSACRSSLHSSGSRARGPPKTPDCRQIRGLLRRPRTPAEAVPGNAWRTGEHR